MYSPKVYGPNASSTVRKSIARVLTVLTQQQRAALRQFYKGKKYLPLDLRAKKTRAQVFGFTCLANFIEESATGEGCCEDYVEDEEAPCRFPRSEIRPPCIDSMHPVLVT
jgi:hypothetical protein